MNVLERLVKVVSNLEARVDRLERLPLIGSGGWIDYSDQSTITGWSSFTTKIIRYKTIGKLVLVDFSLGGASNSDSARFTLPFSRASGSGEIRLPVVVRDNGTFQTQPGLLLITGVITVGIFKDMAATVFTATGTKGVYGQFWYERE